MSTYEKVLIGLIVAALLVRLGFEIGRMGNKK